MPKDRKRRRGDLCLLNDEHAAHWFGLELGDSGIMLDYYPLSETIICDVYWSRVGATIAVEASDLEFV